METMTLSQMLRVSVAMPVLVILSIIILAQAMERCYVFWFLQKLPEDMWERVRAYLQAGDREHALAVCKQSSGILAQAFARMLSLPNPGTEQLVEAFQLYRQTWQMELSRRLGLFGTVSFISPLIGLMGTVLGIMRAFHDLSGAGAGGPAVVAAGISEALVTTAAGIGVAVVSAVAYNYFTLAVRHRMNRVDLWVFEMAQLLEESHG